MPPEVFEELRGETPSPANIAAIEQSVAGLLKPVRPLPSNGWLASLFAIAFVALAIGVAAIFGFNGYRALSMPQMLVEYAVVLGSALLLSFCAVQQMIPGARRGAPPMVAVLVPLVLLSIVIPFLFPNFGTNQFVQLGVPCLRLGTLCAMGGGAVTWMLLRRGFITDPIPAAIAAAGLSGLLGVGVLCLHCPVLNAAHILVWHVGVIVIAVPGGAGIGYAQAR